MPPLSEIKCRPGMCPATSWPVAKKNEPTTKKILIAATLITANQNSISPNHLTPTRFINVTTPKALSANIHCGTSEKTLQYFMYIAIAVMSTTPVNAQTKKYIHPATKEARSPINSLV
ncbi:hypothetical protein D3C81_1591930 [compost metagenome]